MASGPKLVISRLKQDKTSRSLGLWSGWNPCLEGRQGFSVSHCQFIWQLVPQSDTWREDGLIIFLGPAVWDSVLVFVASRSNTQYLDVWKGWYSHHGMNNAEHHNGIGLLSSVLEGFPWKALSHGSDTAGIAIVSCHKYGSSPLDSFYLLMLSVVGGPLTVAAYSTWGLTNVL